MAWILGKIYRLLSPVVNTCLVPRPPQVMVQADQGPNLHRNPWQLPSQRSSGAHAVVGSHRAAHRCSCWPPGPSAEPPAFRRGAAAPPPSPRAPPRRCPWRPLRHRFSGYVERLLREPGIAGRFEPKRPGTWAKMAMEGVLKGFQGSFERCQRFSRVAFSSHSQTFCVHMGVEKYAFMLWYARKKSTLKEKREGG